MDITIIGTGNMARGIASRADAGGHNVTLVAHEDTKADPLAGDVVVLAIPYSAIDDVLGRYGDDLDGKTVVDITNPVDFSSFTPLTLEAGSAAAEIAQKVPGAKVVKAFNTTFAGGLESGGDVGGEPLDVFIASDDDGAKATLTELVESGGMRAVDAGPLARAHELEAVGYLHMALQDSLGTGFGSAVKIVA